MKTKYQDDLNFYVEIWNERDHVSEVSNQHLGDEPNKWFFAHILGKGAYPAFRYRSDNIVLLTAQEHFELDHQTDRAKRNPIFDKVFEKARELKREYHLKERKA